MIKTLAADTHDFHAPPDSSAISASHALQCASSSVDSIETGVALCVLRLEMDGDGGLAPECRQIATLQVRSLRPHA